METNKRTRCKKMKIVPVILSGGSGTRLWPLSRQLHPKQFLALTGEETLLQQTVNRLVGLDLLLGGSEVAAPVVVCNEEHRFLVAEQLREIDKPATTILLEPEGRNTAPALTLAALTCDPDDVLLVMPADHVIKDGAAFQKAVVTGAQLAAAGRMVTFGVVPTSPETGYGYIQSGAPVHEGAFEISRFVEKPDLATAERYLTSGDYLWNSGMFVVKAARWLECLQSSRPDILNACRASVETSRRDTDFTRVDREAFTRCPSDSIDYAVMEKIPAAESAVIPLNAGWSDVGAWSALWEIEAKDACGNVIKGDVLTQDTHNSMIIAKERLVTTIGLSDVVVVETADAVLVASKTAAQDVKLIASALKEQARDEHALHRRVHRPWGSYEGIDVGDRYQVKRITVKPGASLSLQMHHHRAEHWVVVQGTARVVKSDASYLVSENESTYIPLGIKHRLENPGAIPLEIIEVQSGSYLGEDDIVRFEDVYGRNDIR
jgi:mannose-1-phosphate guanylyltransferase/mannose-6-phosphate isomerase